MGGCLSGSLVIDEEKEKRLRGLYGDARIDRERKRFQDLGEAFHRYFGDPGELSFFSAPGRTEIGGNHTDHQNGRVLAAAVDMDAVAAVKKTDDNVIRIKSEGHDENRVELTLLGEQPWEYGNSTAIVRGIAARFKELGFRIGGFSACTVSDVLSGSGLSSSAAFEILVGTIMNHLYNDGAIDPLVLAQIGQYAENRYFGKPCGLMDQAASASGGLVMIDFKSETDPMVERIPFDFSSHGYSLCVVNTGGSHANLTDEYAAIPKEMKTVAGLYQKSVLREVEEDIFFSEIASVRKDAGGDRAVLRALHFFEENRRVAEMADALREDQFTLFLDLVRKSGHSSFCRLQNVISIHSPEDQGPALGIALTERFLKEEGACRVHGGGFAGTIQTYLPTEKTDSYRSAMEKVFGEGCCYILKVRPFGGIKVF